MSVRRAEWGPEINSSPTFGAWRQWMERCGYNPNRVVVPGWAEADDEARTVTVLYAYLDTISEPLPTRETKPFTRQLEAPAPPFPSTGPEGT